MVLSCADLKIIASELKTWCHGVTIRQMLPKCDFTDWWGRGFVGRNQNALYLKRGHCVDKMRYDSFNIDYIASKFPHVKLNSQILK